MKKRRLLANFAAIFAFLAGILIPTSSTPANAVVFHYGWCPNTTVSGFCDTYGTLILYYHPGQDGASSAYLGKIYTYDDYCCWRSVFGGVDGGEGYGTSVRNNAGSGCVDHPSFNYRIYYSPGDGGTSQYMAHAMCQNLNSSLHNNNASQDEAS
ncbi:hypothetical protein AB0O31_07950 [Kitasatospora cineracea]|uniref:hypothetical protein n=1 Tax=Kitasatospora cineracea TaxID=88074 RepID=UPI003430D1A4